MEKRTEFVSIVPVMNQYVKDCVELVQALLVAAVFTAVWFGLAFLAAWAITGVPTW